MSIFLDQARVDQIVHQIETNTVTPETLAIHPAYRAILASLATKLSNHEASIRMHVAETNCAEARFVRRRGNAQHWQDLIDLKSSASTIAKNIRHPDRMAILQAKSSAKLSLSIQLWDQLKGIFDSIQSLPRPEDMVAIVNANGIRRNNVEGRLHIITNYIREFENAWNAARSENTESPTDSGTSSQAAGTEQAQSTVKRTACYPDRKSNSNGEMEV